MSKTCAVKLTLAKVEGIITIGIGILFTLFLPPSAGDSAPLISLKRWRYFNDRQTHILTTRVLRDDPTKALGKIHVSRGEIIKTFGQLRIWVHVVISITAMTPATALQTYAPRIVKSFGFSATRANAMISVGYFIAAAMAVILGYLA